LERVGRARVGVGYRVYVDGDLAYLSHKRGVSIVDVADPSKPRKLSEIETSEDCFGVFAAEGRAYVSDPAAGLVVVDVTDPTNPERLGSIHPRGGTLRDVVVVGEYAYVADFEEAFHIIDVSDPVSPIEVSPPYGSFRADGLAVDGDLVYLASPAKGVQIIDVSDPSAPVLVRTLSRARTSGSVEVAIEGSVLVVSCHGGGVRLFDATDPRSPRYVGRFFDDGEALAACIADGRIVIADNMDGVEVLSLDVSGELIEIAQYETSALHDVFWDGEYIYAADGLLSLLILEAMPEETEIDGSTP